MTNVPPGYWANLQRLGASEALIETAKGIWSTNQPVPEKFAALAEAGARMGVVAGLAGKLNTAMTMLGHAAVDTWRAVNIRSN